MARSIRPHDIVLNQTNITGKRKPTVLVDAVSKRYKIDKETQKRTDEVEGVNVDIIAAHSMVQTVKLPLSVSATCDEIADALRNNKIVSIDFGKPSTLRGKCYAMLRNGQLVSGVSCTADTINIVSIEDDSDEMYFDDDMMI
jgi:hypothetical protein